MICIINGMTTVTAHTVIQWPGRENRRPVVLQYILLQSWTHRRTLRPSLIQLYKIVYDKYNKFYTSIYSQVSTILLCGGQKQLLGLVKFYSEISITSWQKVMMAACDSLATRPCNPTHFLPLVIICKQVHYDLKTQKYIATWFSPNYMQILLIFLYDIVMFGLPSLYVIYVTYSVWTYKTISMYCICET